MTIEGEKGHCGRGFPLSSSHSSKCTGDKIGDENASACPSFPAPRLLSAPGEGATGNAWSRAVKRAMNPSLLGSSSEPGDSLGVGVGVGLCA